jgi:uncharacterized membrane protein
MKLLFSSIIISLLGLFDAAYLTFVHYKHIIPPCSISGSKCEDVLTSQYATIGPIPIALLGVAFYLTVIVLLFVFLETKQKLFVTLAWILTILGVFAAIALLYIQAFVLHAYCQYCVASEIVDFAMFGTVTWLWIRARHNKVENTN